MITSPFQNCACFLLQGSEAPGRIPRAASGACFEYDFIIIHYYELICKNGPEVFRNFSGIMGGILQGDSWGLQNYSPSGFLRPAVGLCGVLGNREREPVRGLWAGQPTSPGPGVFAAGEQEGPLLSAGYAGRRPDARKGISCRGHAEGWKCGAAQGVPLEVLREIWYTVSQKIIDRLGTCRMRGPSLHTAFFMEERK